MSRLLARVLPLLFILSMGVVPAVADDVRPIDCDNAISTYEVNECASRTLEAAQATLAQYLEASFAQNASDPELVRTIKAAHKDWQTYMDSHCHSVATQWRGGSISGVMVISCRTGLTRQRTYAIWENFLTYADSTVPALPEPSMEW